MKKLKLFKKIMFESHPISYTKAFEYFMPLIKLFGRNYNDLCDYRLTQKFDFDNNPTNIFFISNRSLEKTTYTVLSIDEVSKLNFNFLRSEMNHGIYKSNNKAKAIKYFGKSKQLVNSPYMIELNFGDYIVISNELMMVVPKKKFKLLFN